MRSLAFVTAASFLACATTHPRPEAVELLVRLPPGATDRGVVTSMRFTTGEVEGGVHRELAHVFTRFERLERAQDRDDDPSTLTLAFASTGSPSYVAVYLDARGDGLEVLFEEPIAFVELPAAGRAEATVPAPPSTLTRKPPCTGPRMERLFLEASELAREGDDGRHALCVYLPPSYEREPTRRYPLVLALPGFSGHDAQQDGFGARALFDEQAATTGVEVLLVGVETRSPEGTSYLSSSERFGDWEGYVSRRVLPELERRYRTTARRAVFGHSTGGWNALSLALRHPALFDAVGVSSPDPLDLDAWLLDENGVVKPKWRHWHRAEQRLGGRGQFTSWAASWSPTDDGFEWLLDDAGRLREPVYARWKAHSPMAGLSEAAARLSGRLFLTAGRNDMFDLFAPTQRFVEAARERGLVVEWAPTDLDHFGEDRARFSSLVAFLLARLAE